MSVPDEADERASQHAFGREGRALREAALLRGRSRHDAPPLLFEAALLAASSPLASERELKQVSRAKPPTPPPLTHLPPPSARRRAVLRVRRRVHV